MSPYFSLYSSIKLICFFGSSRSAIPRKGRPVGPGGNLATNEPVVLTSRFIDNQSNASDIKEVELKDLVKGAQLLGKGKANVQLEHLCYLEWRLWCEIFV